MACSSMSVRKASAACVNPSRSSGVVVSRRRPVVVVAAARSAAEVPANVAEARAWIAAWRSKQGKQSAAANGNGNGNGAAAAPSKAAARGGAGGGKFAAAAVADGALVFTADQLKAVSYTDVKLKQGGKRK